MPKIISKAELDARRARGASVEVRRSEVAVGLEEVAGKLQSLVDSVQGKDDAEQLMASMAEALQKVNMGPVVEAIAGLKMTVNVPATDFSPLASAIEALQPSIEKVAKQKMHADYVFSVERNGRGQIETVHAVVDRSRK